MKYLLDVNALVAFGFLHHQFHARVIDWLRTDASPTLLTSSVTELGFVRILAQVPAYQSNVENAKNLLLELKSNRIVPLLFIPDANDISHLPAWAKAPKQTTDGHLVKLAAAHGAVLATLHSGIPGAFRIP
jgi:predicted nucleic acid-binding protein